MVGVGKEGRRAGGGRTRDPKELSIRINFSLLDLQLLSGGLEASTCHSLQFSECVPLRRGHVLFF